MYQTHYLSVCCVLRAHVQFRQFGRVDANRHCNTDRHPILVVFDHYVLSLSASGGRGPKLLNQHSICEHIMCDNLYSYTIFNLQSFAT